MGKTVIPFSDRGVANGVASLDAGGMVPPAQLPAGGGDVIGPGPAVVDETEAVYDGVGGLTIKEGFVRQVPGASGTKVKQWIFARANGVMQVGMNANGRPMNHDGTGSQDAAWLSDIGWGATVTPVVATPHLVAAADNHLLVRADTVGGAVVVTLPISGAQNRILAITRIGSFSVTINAGGGEFINGGSSYVLGSDAETVIIRDFAIAGNEWVVIGEAGRLAALEASATGSTAETSAAFILLDSMAITPGAGTYLANFSSSLECSADELVEFALFAAGSEVAHTSRRYDVGGGGAGKDTPKVCGTNGEVVVAAGQAVEVRWKTSGGTVTAHERTLNLIKVA